MTVNGEETSDGRALNFGPGPSGTTPQGGKATDASNVAIDMNVRASYRSGPG